MRRWIIVTLIFALAHIGCETDEQQMARQTTKLKVEQENELMSTDELLIIDYPEPPPKIFIGEVGVLDWSTGRLVFTGELDESVKVFFEYLKPYVEGYIEGEVKRRMEGNNKDVKSKSILTVADKGRSYYGNRPYSKSADMRLAVSRIPGLVIGEGTIEVYDKPFDRLDHSDPVIRMGHSELSRQEQVSLMAECVEDAITVCQDANIYPLSSWYKTDALDSEMLKGDKSVILAAEIAVAFFNYRTRGN